MHYVPSYLPTYVTVETVVTVVTVVKVVTVVTVVRKSGILSTKKSHATSHIFFFLLAQLFWKEELDTFDY